MAERLASKTVRFLQESADPDITGHGIIGGEILKRKMRTLIRCMDMDTDGFLSRKDFELLGQRLAESFNFDSLKTTYCVNQLLKQWDVQFEPFSEDGKLSAGGLIKALQKCGRDMVIALTAIRFANAFDVVDTNKDGLIGKEEFVQYHKVFQIEDAEISEASFNSIDENRNGSITQFEFVQAGIDYYVSNDPDSPYNLLYGPLVDDPLE